MMKLINQRLMKLDQERADHHTNKDRKDQALQTAPLHRAFHQKLIRHQFRLHFHKAILVDRDAVVKPRTSAQLDHQELKVSMDILDYPDWTAWMESQERMQKISRLNIKIREFASIAHRARQERPAHWAKQALEGSRELTDSLGYLEEMDSQVIPENKEESDRAVILGQSEIKVTRGGMPKSQLEDQE